MAVTKTYGLTTDGGIVDLPGAVTVNDTLPDQTGNTGKFLKTDGAVISWDTPPTPAAEIPTISGHTGEYLTNDGNTVGWGAVAASSTSGLISPSAITIPSGLVKVSGRPIIEIQAINTFANTIANVKTNPPTGWAWVQSGNILTCDVNTTVANALYLKGRGDIQPSLWTGGFVNGGNLLYKSIDAFYDYDCYVRLRSRIYGADTMSDILAMCPWSQGYWIRADLVGTADYSSITSGAPIASGDTARIGTGLTVNNQSNGFWVHFRKRGFVWSIRLSSTDSLTIPKTNWGSATSGKLQPAGQNGMAMWWLGFMSARWSNASAIGADLEVFEFSDYILSDGIPTGYSCWSGWSTNNNDITLIDSFDLKSADATIDQTKLRAILTDATNCRTVDTATITYSAVRSSSPSPAASTYQSADAVTVSGTGQYFSLYGRLVSSGTTQGSIDLSRILIPVS